MENLQLSEDARLNAILGDKLSQHDQQEALFVFLFIVFLKTLLLI